MHLYEKHSGFPWRGLVVTVVAFGLIIALFTSLMGQAGNSADERQTDLLVTAIRNAAVTSYATEGRYPATLEEIVQTYGIVIDHDRFHVSYVVDEMSNLMPSIRVKVKGEGEA